MLVFKKWITSGWDFGRFSDWAQFLLLVYCFLKNQNLSGLICVIYVFSWKRISSSPNNMWQSFSLTTKTPVSVLVSTLYFIFFFFCGEKGLSVGWSLEFFPCGFSWLALTCIGRIEFEFVVIVRNSDTCLDGIGSK